MNAKTIIIVCILMKVTLNNGLIQLENSLTTSTSPLLKKILQSIDAATNDDHLINVTLKLLKSLCYCMDKTLNARPEKLNSSLDYVENKDNINNGMFILYKNIYNNTCYNLNEVLKIHPVENEDELLNISSCTQDQVNLELNLPNITENLQTENPRNLKLEHALLKSLLQSNAIQKYHSRRVFIANDNSSRINDREHSFEVIIKLQIDKNYVHLDLNKSTANEYIDRIVDITSSADIYVTQTKYTETETSNGNGNVETFEDCNLRSLYLFIAKNEEENCTNVSKLFYEDNTLEIVIGIKSPTDYIDICCENYLVATECEVYLANHFELTNKSSVKNDENNMKNVFQHYENRISDINKLVNQYYLKSNLEGYQNNETNLQNSSESTLSATNRKQTINISEYIQPTTTVRTTLKDITQAIILLSELISKENTQYSVSTENSNTNDDIRIINQENLQTNTLYEQLSDSLTETTTEKALEPSKIPVLFTEKLKIFEKNAADSSLLTPASPKDTSGETESQTKSVQHFTKKHYGTSLEEAVIVSDDRNLIVSIVPKDRFSLFKNIKYNDIFMTPARNIDVITEGPSKKYLNPDDNLNLDNVTETGLLENNNNNTIILQNSTLYQSDINIQTIKPTLGLENTTKTIELQTITDDKIHFKNKTTLKFQNINISSTSSLTEINNNNEISSETKSISKPTITEISPKYDDFIIISNSIASDDLIFYKNNTVIYRLYTTTPLNLENYQNNETHLRNSSETTLTFATNRKPNIDISAYIQPTTTFRTTFKELISKENTQYSVEPESISTENSTTNDDIPIVNQENIQTNTLFKHLSDSSPETTTEKTLESSSILATALPEDTSEETKRQTKSADNDQHEHNTVQHFTKRDYVTSLEETLTISDSKIQIVPIVSKDSFTGLNEIKYDDIIMTSARNLDVNTEGQSVEYSTTNDNLNLNNVTDTGLQENINNTIILLNSTLYQTNINIQTLKPMLGLKNTTDAIVQQKIKDNKIHFKNETTSKFQNTNISSTDPLKEIHNKGINSETKSISKQTITEKSRFEDFITFSNSIVFKDLFFYKNNTVMYRLYTTTPLNSESYQNNENYLQNSSETTLNATYRKPTIDISEYIQPTTTVRTTFEDITQTIILLNEFISKENTQYSVEPELISTKHFNTNDEKPIVNQENIQTNTLFKHLSDSPETTTEKTLEPSSILATALAEDTSEENKRHTKSADDDQHAYNTVQHFRDYGTSLDEAFIISDNRNPIVSINPKDRFTVFNEIKYDDIFTTSARNVDVITESPSVKYLNTDNLNLDNVTETGLQKNHDNTIILLNSTLYQTDINIQTLKPILSLENTTEAIVHETIEDNFNNKTPLKFQNINISSTDRMNSGTKSISKQTMSEKSSGFEDFIVISNSIASEDLKSYYNKNNTVTIKLNTTTPSSGQLQLNELFLSENIITTSTIDEKYHTKTDQNFNILMPHVQLTSKRIKTTKPLVDAPASMRAFKNKTKALKKVPPKIYWVKNMKPVHMLQEKTEQYRQNVSDSPITFIKYNSNGKIINHAKSYILKNIPGFHNPQNINKRTTSSNNNPMSQVLKTPVIIEITSEYSPHKEVATRYEISKNDLKHHQPRIFRIKNMKPLHKLQENSRVYTQNVSDTPITFIKYSSNGKLTDNAKTYLMKHILASQKSPNMKKSSTTSSKIDTTNNVLKAYSTQKEMTTKFDHSQISKAKSDLKDHQLSYAQITSFHNYTPLPETITKNFSRSPVTGVKETVTKSNSIAPATNISQSYDLVKTTVQYNKTLIIGIYPNTTKENSEYSSMPKLNTIQNRNVSETGYNLFESSLKDFNATLSRLLKVTINNSESTILDSKNTIYGQNVSTKLIKSVKNITPKILWLKKFIPMREQQTSSNYHLFNFNKTSMSPVTTLKYKINGLIITAKNKHTETKKIEDVGQILTTEINAKTTLYKDNQLDKNNLANVDVTKKLELNLENQAENIPTDIKGKTSTTEPYTLQKVWYASNNMPPHLSAESTKLSKVPIKDTSLNFSTIETTKIISQSDNNDLLPHLYMTTDTAVFKYAPKKHNWNTSNEIFIYSKQSPEDVLKWPLDSITDNFNSKLSINNEKDHHKIKYTFYNHESKENSLTDHPRTIPYKLEKNNNIATKTMLPKGAQKAELYGNNEMSTVIEFFNKHAAPNSYDYIDMKHDKTKQKFQVTKSQENNTLHSKDKLTESPHYYLTNTNFQPVKELKNMESLNQNETNSVDRKMLDTKNIRKSHENAQREYKLEKVKNHVTVENLSMENNFYSTLNNIKYKKIDNLIFYTPKTTEDDSIKRVIEKRWFKSILNTSTETYAQNSADPILIKNPSNSFGNNAFDINSLKYSAEKSNSNEMLSTHSNYILPILYAHAHNLIPKNGNNVKKSVFSDDTQFANLYSTAIEENTNQLFKQLNATNINFSSNEKVNDTMALITINKTKLKPDKIYNDVELISNTIAIKLKNKSQLQSDILSSQHIENPQLSKFSSISHKKPYPLSQIFTIKTRENKADTEIQVNLNTTTNQEAYYFDSQPRIDSTLLSSTIPWYESQSNIEVTTEIAVQSNANKVEYHKNKGDTIINYTKPNFNLYIDTKQIKKYENIKVLNHTRLYPVPPNFTVKTSENENDTEIPWNLNTSNNQEASNFDSQPIIDSTSNPIIPWHESQSSSEVTTEIAVQLIANKVEYSKNIDDTIIHYTEPDFNLYKHTKNIKKYDNIEVPTHTTLYSVSPIFTIKTSENENDTEITWNLNTSKNQECSNIDRKPTTHSTLLAPIIPWHKSQANIEVTTEVATLLNATKVEYSENIHDTLNDYSEPHFNVNKNTSNIKPSTPYIDEHTVLLYNVEIPTIVFDGNNLEQTTEHNFMNKSLSTDNDNFLFKINTEDSPIQSYFDTTKIRPFIVNNETMKVILREKEYDVNTSVYLDQSDDLNYNIIKKLQTSTANVYEIANKASYGTNLTTFHDTNTLTLTNRSGIEKSQKNKIFTDNPLKITSFNNINNLILNYTLLSKTNIVENQVQPLLVKNETSGVDLRKKFHDLRAPIYLDSLYSNVTKPHSNSSNNDLLSYRSNLNIINSTIYETSKLLKVTDENYFDHTTKYDFLRHNLSIDERNDFDNNLNHTAGVYKIINNKTILYPDVDSFHENIINNDTNSNVIQQHVENSTTRPAYFHEITEEVKLRNGYADFTETAKFRDESNFKVTEIIVEDTTIIPQLTNNKIMEQPQSYTVLTESISPIAKPDTRSSNKQNIFTKPYNEKELTISIKKNEINAASINKNNIEQITTTYYTLPDSPTTIEDQNKSNVGNKQNNYNISFDTTDPVTKAYSDVNGDKIVTNVINKINLEQTSEYTFLFKTVSTTKTRDDFTNNFYGGHILFNTNLKGENNKLNTIVVQIENIENKTSSNEHSAVKTKTPKTFYNITSNDQKFSKKDLAAFDNYLFTKEPTTKQSSSNTEVDVFKNIENNYNITYDTESNFSETETQMNQLYSGNSREQNISTNKFDFTESSFQVNDTSNRLSKLGRLMTHHTEPYLNLTEIQIASNDNIETTAEIAKSGTDDAAVVTKAVNVRNNLEQSPEYGFITDSANDYDNNLTFEGAVLSKISTKDLIWNNTSDEKQINKIINIDMNTNISSEEHKTELNWSNNLNPYKNISDFDSHKVPTQSYTTPQFYIANKSDTNNFKQDIFYNYSISPTINALLKENYHFTLNTTQASFINDSQEINVTTNNFYLNDYNSIALADILFSSYGKPQSGVKETNNTIKDVQSTIDIQSESLKSNLPLDFTKGKVFDNRTLNKDIIMISRPVQTDAIQSSSTTNENNIGVFGNNKYLERSSITLKMLKPNVYIFTPKANIIKQYHLSETNNPTINKLIFTSLESGADMIDYKFKQKKTSNNFFNIKQSLTNDLKSKAKPSINKRITIGNSGIKKQKSIVTKMFTKVIASSTKNILINDFDSILVQSTPIPMDIGQVQKPINKTNRYFYSSNEHGEHFEFNLNYFQNLLNNELKNNSQISDDNGQLDLLQTRVSETFIKNKSTLDIHLHNNAPLYNTKEMAKVELPLNIKTIDANHENRKKITTRPKINQHNKTSTTHNKENTVAFTNLINANTDNFNLTKKENALYSYGLSDKLHHSVPISEHVITNSNGIRSLKELTKQYTFFTQNHEEQSLLHNHLKNIKYNTYQPLPNDFELITYESPPHLKSSTNKRNTEGLPTTTVTFHHHSYIKNSGISHIKIEGKMTRKYVNKNTQTVADSTIQNVLLVENSTMETDTGKPDVLLRSMAQVNNFVTTYRPFYKVSNRILQKTSTPRTESSSKSRIKIEAKMSRKYVTKNTKTANSNNRKTVSQNIPIVKKKKIRTSADFQNNESVQTRDLNIRSQSRKPFLSPLSKTRLYPVKELELMKQRNKCKPQNIKEIFNINARRSQPVCYTRKNILMIPHKVTQPISSPVTMFPKLTVLGSKYEAKHTKIANNLYYPDHRNFYGGRNRYDKIYGFKYGKRTNNLNDFFLTSTSTTKKSIFNNPENYFSMFNEKSNMYQKIDSFRNAFLVTDKSRGVYTRFHQRNDYDEDRHLEVEDYRLPFLDDKITATSAAPAIKKRNGGRTIFFLSPTESDASNRMDYYE